MLEKILSSPDLPSLPKIAMELLELTRDPDVELTEIARLVQYDPALSSKILRTVNSSYYSLSQPCPTIKRALAYLGLSTVKSLVLGFSLVDLAKKRGDGFDLIDYWRRSIYSAAAARRIATNVHCGDPEEAFLAGLMQDIGMLAMHATLGSTYTKLLGEAAPNHHLLPQYENSVFGFTHADVGGRLGENWGFPAQLVEPIRQHHINREGEGPHAEMINTVVLGYQLSNLVTANDRKAAFEKVNLMSKRFFDMPLWAVRDLIASSFKDAAELSSLLDVRVGEQPDVAVILAEAEEARIRHHFNGKEQAPQQQRPCGEELVRHVLTDPLTGLGSRQHLLEEMEVRFDQAKTRDGCLGMILVEVDDLCETAGDHVLVQTARCLGEAVGDDGLVFRSGGQEFAILVPGADRIQAATMAERLREVLEEAPIDPAVEAKAVKVSLGVAALEPEVRHLLTRPGLLRELANMSVEAAREAGGNCVRVFSPKPRPSSAA